MAQNTVNTRDQLSDNQINEESENPHRLRTLTDKGTQLIEDTQNEYTHKLQKAWENVEQCIEQSNTCPNNIESIRQVERNLSSNMNNYRKISEDYVGYLSRTNIEESRRELDSHMALLKAHELFVQNAVKQLDTHFQMTFETGSYSRSKSSKSVKSIRSNKSDISSLLTKKIVQAQATQAGIEFVKKETDLRKRQAQLTEKQQVSEAQTTRIKAELDADLHLLIKQREKSEIAAQVQALRALSDATDNVSDNGSIIDLPFEDNKLRTERYVNSHSTENSSCPDIRNPIQRERSKFVPTPRTVQPTKMNFLSISETSVTSLNPTAPSFNPQIEQKQEICANAPQLPNWNETVQGSSITSDFTRFLLKKDLVLSRLTNYNDCPESYGIWKSSFKTIMAELQVSPAEELDLLTKWLGKESSKYAPNIRAACVHNPTNGLQRVWERLSERYGSPELIEAALKTKLQQFPRLTNKDNRKLYELADLLSEIEATKEDENYSKLLSYFDTSSGVIPIISKLPYNIQEKWTSQAVRYKAQNKVAYPPFSFFVQFIRDISKTKNDPGFMYESFVAPIEKPSARSTGLRPMISAKKTDISSETTDTKTSAKCPLHNTNHVLNDCKAFRVKPMDERKAILKEHNICFKCCSSSSHIARTCQEKLLCKECESDKHPTGLHIQPRDRKFRPNGNYGGESASTIKEASSSVPVTTKCTQICHSSFSGKSCGKTVLVNVYPKNHPEQAKKMYAVLDDQSNRSLAGSKFFDQFCIQGKPIPYTLSSCAGQINTSGRRASGYIIESVYNKEQLELPMLIECNSIPEIRDEIPTPDVARYHPHLRDIEQFIPPVDDEVPILLLIGRNLPDAHHVLDQRIGSYGSPYAQKLPLGWVIVGESCLQKVHKPDFVNVKKTHFLSDGRPSLFPPCPYKFDVKENCRKATEYKPLQNEEELFDIFRTTPQDNKVGMSVEDRKFLSIMAKELHKGPNGNLTAPLPFRSPRPRLPNNRSQAVHRAKTLHNSLLRNPTKQQQFHEFMKAIFDSGHAEPAPPVSEGEECWYLPLFGVYHPKKPNQLRGVFDSSATYGGVCLNDVLLTGPDLTNSLLGVLLRFRNGPIAVTMDIGKMFYSFYVTENHRNYIRFLWYRNNDPRNEMIDYRMCVHVFGNAPSPAVATYCLRQIAKDSEEKYGEDIVQLISRNFYVDDGLLSSNTPEEAIDLVKRTQEALRTGGNVRLHKIASNSSTVLKAFPSEDHAKNLKNLDMSQDAIPMQRSLGLIWDIQTDTFNFQVLMDPKPYTRRGVLSTINGIFDPIGFLAPVIIQGKILLRDLMIDAVEWDEPLSPEREGEWQSWRESLVVLEDLQIPRNYSTTAEPDIAKREVHVFSDASEKAIAAACYLHTTSKDARHQTSFIMGKAKVAPSHGHTIPRLEFCGAVLAVDIAECVSEQMNIPLDSFYFHTDSKVVLGYIHNESRRFYVYVSNRVQRIRKSTTPQQWEYVKSSLNPADDATRSVPANQIKSSNWFQGPSFLNNDQNQLTKQVFDLAEPNGDQEVRPMITSMATQVSDCNLGTHRFERFSSWSRLVNAIQVLTHIAHSYGTEENQQSCKGWHSCLQPKSVKRYLDAELHIIKEVQREAFNKELQAIREKKPIPKDSPLVSLSPQVDEKGLLRVGGRLNQARLDIEQKNPIIIPGKHHVATLLVRHHHDLIKHQGRHLTEGAVRSAGLWITGVKRLIGSILHICVQCRKLRGKQAQQKMSDLPVERITPSPPFTYVGVDTFGPWTIIARKTRGGHANAKRWAILFTCLSTRAVHIEVIEEMSSSSFINALRRFVSIRGPVTQFRSDRGTNFIGATDPLQIDAINVEDGPLHTYLYNKGVEWVFNPPHSSHMGGVWERLIGVTRRIFDSMMTDTSVSRLTHDVLTTFMAEAAAIINARPLVPVSTDPENPFVLSPAMLLTHKTGPTLEPKNDGDFRDLYRAEWKRVQALAEMFWNRWRQEYMHTLQIRRK